MRRAGLGGFFVMYVLSRLSPPQCLLDARFVAEAEKWDCHKLSEGHPEGAELRTRSAEASGFDRTARRGRTGHKERTPWG
jgi:hypothetical protein